MATRTNRLERITNLLLALLHTSQPLSLREIGVTVAGYPAEQGALRQAFERDKRTLRDEGIPIATERIDGEDQIGYRILPEQYYLPDLELARDEREALSFALAAVRLDGSSTRDLQAKLGADLAKDLPPVVMLPSLPALGLLQEAVQKRAPACFTYRERSREVCGYGLVFKEGSWYFIGRDRSSEGDDGALRTFRVDRIVDTPQLLEPDSYELPENFNAARELHRVPFAPIDAQEVDDLATEVVIDVDARESRRVLSLVGAKGQIDGAPEGSTRLAFSIGDEAAFVSWILGLGDSVVVCSPPRLRDAVIAALSLATKKRPT